MSEEPSTLGEAVKQAGDHEERTVALLVDKFENVVEAKCSACQMVLQKADEYHPAAFCVLYRAGLHPHEVVREASKPGRIPEPPKPLPVKPITR